MGSELGQEFAVVRTKLDAWRARATTILLVASSIVQLPVVVLGVLDYGPPVNPLTKALCLIAYLVVVATALLHRVNYRKRLTAAFAAAYVVIALTNLVNFSGTWAKVGLIAVPIIALVLCGSGTARILVVVGMVILFSSPFLRVLPGVADAFAIGPMEEVPPRIFLYQAGVLAAFLVAVMILLERFERFLLDTEIEDRKLHNELAQVTRVATMGELTSSLAHELNQPLAAIRNYANAAQRFLSQSEPNLTRVREAMEGILRDDKRAAAVISGVRGLLRQEDPHYSLLHMNNLIQETLDFICTDSALEGMSIGTELSPKLPTVLGDRVQLQQVLINLMLNAVDAANNVDPDLRKLVIRTENEEDGAVKISVRDFGAGFDETHKDKLFEPFHTTKPGGLGMGLAISARIVNAHAGLIRGENNPDGGATFWFTLPAMTERKVPHGA